jgi:DNA-binding transcriptional MerR regulator
MSDFHDQVPDKLYFRIGEIAKLVGVDAHVLRYWESEFGMKPHRSSTGQRMYRKQDLTRFLKIRSLLHDEGYTLTGARKVLREGGREGSATPAQIHDALEKARALQARIQEMRAELLG